MNPIIRLAIAAGIAKGAEYLGKEMKFALAPIGPYLRTLSLGVLLVLASLLAWFSGLFFFLLSFFLYLSDASSYLTPAIWTGLASFAIGFVLIFLGFGFIRKLR